MHKKIQRLRNYLPLGIFCHSQLCGNEDRKVKRPVRAGPIERIFQCENWTHCAFRELASEASARERTRSASIFFFPHHYPLALAVNKSPAVYILSPALDGLWRENRRSVNRLRKILSSHHLLEKSFFSKISIEASERIKKSTHAVSPSRKINLFHTKDALTKAKRKGLSC